MVSGAVITVVAGLTTTNVLAQALALEEIIVTAQRREQSLQEVPISMEVFTGESLKLQGYRNFEDLSKFSPSVTVRDGSSQQTTTIRGFGTEGNSLTLQTATPIFLDGIHFGRLSMIKTAFMDVDSVEVLKGPQPLYFGMDATAGAFNIQSQRPTAEWEADLSSEVGNDGKYEVEGALGGPLTDTLGIRVAGLVEHSNGPVRNRLTKEKYLGFNNMAGRVLLAWTPSEKFKLTGKFEASDQNNAGELWMGCLTKGNLAGFSGNSPLVGPSFAAGTGNERSVYAPPPKGVSFETDAVLLEVKDGKDCFKGEYGISRDGPYLEPIQTIFPGFTAGANQRPGYIDIRAVSEAFNSVENPGIPGVDGLDMGGADGKDEAFTWNALIDWNYEFDNGITVNSQTGMVFFDRINIRENCDCFFFANHFSRTEYFNQWSQQVRFETADEGFDLNLDMPGGLTVNAMAGAFVQKTDLNASTNSLRADLRQGQRYQDISENGTWLAGFWNLDFNFLDKQVIASIGGRYTDVAKKTGSIGFGAQWIFDVFPCNALGTDANVATCTRDPQLKQVNPNLTTYTTTDQNGITGTGVRVDSPRIFADPSTVSMNNLWTPRNFLGPRPFPLSWLTADVNAVGLTAPDYNIFSTFGDCDNCSQPYIEQDANHYDTQIVLSYTPDTLGRDHTFYSKYVSAFKGPVTDTGLSSIDPIAADIIYLPEYATAYELGAKGILFDSRFRYDITAFRNKFKDLQTEGIGQFFSGPEDQQRIGLNAGGQLVKGVEFAGQVAATQNLMLNFAGVLMDGKMVDFDGGGCSDDEFAAAAVDAINNPAGRSATELAFADSILNRLGPARRAHALSLPVSESYLLNGGCRLESEVLPDGRIATPETFNRSGSVAPKTPDYKFVIGANYELPVMDDRFLAFINAQGYISDGYLTGNGADIYTRVQTFNKHGDLNLSVGLGAPDDTWKIVAYARNILGAVMEYNEEANFIQSGLIRQEVPDSAFFSYGLRLEYNFR